MVMIAVSGLGVQMFGEQGMGKMLVAQSEF